jgi:hypothetical protein
MIEARHVQRQSFIHRLRRLRRFEAHHLRNLRNLWIVSVRNLNVAPTLQIEETLVDDARVTLPGTTVKSTVDS